MFVARKPQQRKKKHSAKTVSTPPPNPPPTYLYVPIEVHPPGSLSPPPPYALLCPPPPPPPRHLPPPRPLPLPATPCSPAHQTATFKKGPSKPAGKAKPQKKTSTPSKPKPQTPIPNAIHDTLSASPVDPWCQTAAQPMADRALCDLISSKFNTVITSIDSESFSGNQQELEIRDEDQVGLRGGWGSAGGQISRRADRAISSAIISTNYFSKVNLYANSKLPPNLPPLRL